MQIKIIMISSLTCCFQQVSKYEIHVRGCCFTASPDSTDPRCSAGSRDIAQLTVCLGLEYLRRATGGPLARCQLPLLPHRQQRSPTWKYFCRGQRSLPLNLSGNVCPQTENTTCNERNVAGTKRDGGFSLARHPAGCTF